MLGVELGVTGSVEGVELGTALGFIDGTSESSTIGLKLGALVGSTDGASKCKTEGVSLHAMLGVALGETGSVEGIELCTVPGSIDGKSE